MKGYSALPSITGALPSDCLMLYIHVGGGGGSYPLATTPTNRAVTERFYMNKGFSLKTLR